MRNQTDGTDQEEEGRTLDDVLNPTREDNGFTNAGYETSTEPKAVYLREDSPTTKHGTNSRDSTKRSLERYRKAKGKSGVYTISSKQSNLQGSSRSVDRSLNLKGTRMTLNKFPTGAEEQQVRIRSQVSRSGSGDVDGLHEEPPHHHGSKPSVVSTGEAVVPVDYEESQRSLSRQSAGRQSSDTSSAGSSMVPGLHDSISVDVISIRL